MKQHENDIDGNIGMFQTQDFYISCVLKATGLQISNLVHNNKGRVTFIFLDPNNIAENTIQNHWNNSLKINSLDFVEAINQLKTRIYSGV